MIEIIALIEVKDNAAYAEYETQAVRIMKRHGGKLVSAFEPDKKETTESNVSEVHYLQFPDLNSFKEYRSSFELSKFSELREKAISNIKIIVSGKSKSYES